MSYQCIHTLPGQAEMNLFHAVTDRCYPVEKKQFLSSGINQQYLVRLLVLLQDGLPCGRLAIYFNPQLAGGTWLIGNYDCIVHSLAAAFLLNEAETYIREQGGKKILGPMNGSTWDDYRFTSSGEEGLFFTEHYRNPWYAQQFIQNGFAVNARYFSGKDRLMKYQRPEVLERKSELEKDGIVFRPINLDNYETELRKLYPFLLKAFETNYLYSSIDEESFVQKYLVVKPYIDPQFVLLAENVEQETVGVLFCLPDHLNKKEKGLVIKTIARKNGPQFQGLGRAMAEIIYATAHQEQIRYIIHAFMYQEGTSVEASRNYSGMAFKQYALYEKHL